MPNFPGLKGFLPNRRWIDESIPKKMQAIANRPSLNPSRIRHKAVIIGLILYFGYNADIFGKSIIPIDGQTLLTAGLGVCPFCRHIGTFYSPQLLF